MNKFADGAVNDAEETRSPMLMECGHEPLLLRGVPMPDSRKGRTAATDRSTQRRHGDRRVTTISVDDGAEALMRSATDTMWYHAMHAASQHVGLEGACAELEVLLSHRDEAVAHEELRFGRCSGDRSQWHPSRRAEDSAMADILSGLPASVYTDRVPAARSRGES